MTLSGSVSVWIAGLQSGNLAAFESLWRRYAEALATEVERRLPAGPGTYDGDDVAQSVFTAIWAAAESGRLQDFRSRDELWWFLTAVAKRKSIDRLRRESALKRGGGRVQNESALARADGAGYRLELLVDETPGPQQLADLQDEYAELMAGLGDPLLQGIAHARLVGYDVSEIARRVGVSRRTVERKLRVIRGRWASYLDAFDHAADAADCRR